MGGKDSRVGLSRCMSSSGEMMGWIGYWSGTLIDTGQERTGWRTSRVGQMMIMDECYAVKEVTMSRIDVKLAVSTYVGKRMEHRDNSDWKDCWFQWCIMCVWYDNVICLMPCL